MDLWEAHEQSEDLRRKQEAKESGKLLQWPGGDISFEKNTKIGGKGYACIFTAADGGSGKAHEVAKILHNQELTGKNYPRVQVAGQDYPKGTYYFALTFAQMAEIRKVYIVSLPMASLSKKVDPVVEGDGVTVSGSSSLPKGTVEKKEIKDSQQPRTSTSIWSFFKRKSAESTGVVPSAGSTQSAASTSTATATATSDAQPITSIVSKSSMKKEPVVDLNPYTPPDEELEGALKRPGVNTSLATSTSSG